MINAYGQLREYGLGPDLHFEAFLSKRRRRGAAAIGVANQEMRHQLEGGN